MSARLMLAAIEWNNTIREEQVDETGQSATSVVYSKRRKSFVLKKKYKITKSNHVHHLLARVYEVHKDKIPLPPFRKPAGLPAVVSGGAPKPAKSDLQEKFRSRFGK